MKTRLKNIYVGETAKQLWRGLTATSTTPIYTWTSIPVYEQTGQTGTPTTMGRTFAKGLNEGHVYIAYFNTPIAMSATPTEADIDCIYEFDTKIGG